MMSIATLNVQSTQAADSTASDAAVLAVIDTLRKAHLDKNAGLFAAQFSPDAAIFNLAPPLVHHGVDLREKQAWMDSWATPIEIDARDLNVTVSGDFAFVHGFLHLSGTKKGADYPVSFWMRETVCLERQGSGWRIVHEHTSVPFYMDGSLRPAFDLEP
jgi:ketosteroid isomerase-like protein